MSEIPQAWKKTLKENPEAFSQRVRSQLGVEFDDIPLGEKREYGKVVIQGDDWVIKVAEGAPAFAGETRSSRKMKPEYYRKQKQGRHPV